MGSKIVVWDARGTARGGWAEGEVVEEDLRTRKELVDLGAGIDRGGYAVALPVDRELLRSGNPVAGYYRRTWGRGERYGRDAGRGCPMLLWAHPDYRFLHWAARVRSEVRPAGKLRLAVMPVPGAFVGGLSATAEAYELGALAERPEVPGGGWLVGGVAGVTVEAEGYLSLCLLGVGADGIVVEWSAVTQASRPS